MALLYQISIPADVANRRLQNLILLEQTEQADFLRQAEIVRKETERQVSIKGLSHLSR